MPQKPTTREKKLEVYAHSLEQVIAGMIRKFGRDGRSLTITPELVEGPCRWHTTWPTSDMAVLTLVDEHEEAS